MVECKQCRTMYDGTKRKHRLCLSCKRTYDKSWRSKRKEIGSPVISSKMPTEYHREYQKTYSQKESVKRRKAEFSAKRRADPSQKDRINARYLVRIAIKQGKLIKQPCQVCGEKKVDAHHENYSEPLLVMWLCRTHHIQHHINAKAEGTL